MWDAASESVAESTLHSKVPAELLAENAAFVSKLNRKLKHCFCERGASGIVSLSDAFRHIDKAADKYVFDSEEKDAKIDQWQFRTIVEPHVPALSERELEVFFAVLDADRDGIVDLVDALLYCRRVSHCSTQQFHDTLRHVRSRILHDRIFLASRVSELNTIEQIIAMAAADAEKQFRRILHTRKDLFDLLVSDDFRCTVSEACFVIEYLVDETEEEDHVDLNYFTTAATAVRLPDDIAYPLLLGKFLDAATDEDKTPNGSVGIISCAGPPEKELSQHEFREFMTKFGGSLSIGECDLLFGYLCADSEDTQRKVVSVNTVLSIVREKVVPLSPDHLDVARDAVRRHIVRKTEFGLCNLYSQLAACCSEEISCVEFTKVLRNCGVSRSITDIVLENLHRESPRAIQFVLSLRGPLPLVVEDVVRKLFDRLDPDKSGVVSRALMLSEFVPEEMEQHTLRVSRAQRSYNSVTRAMEEFLSSLPRNDATITFESFLFFWGNISTAFEDSSEFTLLLWKGYEMGRDSGGRSMSRRRATSSSPVSGSSPAKSPVGQPNLTPRRGRAAGKFSQNMSSHFSF